MNRAVFIGERNPQGNEPLSLLPRGGAGSRLCNLVLGMSEEDYLASFDRINLLTGLWDDDAARLAAGKISRLPRTILLGRRVCRAFDVPFEPLRRVVFAPFRMALVLPHPSGLCRAWNDPEMVRRARQCVSTFVPEVAHLIGRDGT